MALPHTLTCSVNNDGQPEAPLNSPPIAMLSDDVLLLLLKTVLANHTSVSVSRLTDSGRDRVDTSALLTLTHVCRRWRGIALGYAPLWTHVDGACPAQLVAFLGRSGSLPLSLILRTNVEGIREILSEHGPRIRRLYLSASINMRDIRPLLTFSPTMLQCLTITFPEEVDHSYTPTPPGLLFDQSAVALKALAIYRTPNWIPGNAFPDLTHFHLVAEGLIDYPGTSSIHSLLRNAPRLEVLHIYGIAPVRDSGPTPTPILLQYLRSLTIVCGCLETTAFLIQPLILRRDISIYLDHMFELGQTPPQLPCLRTMNPFISLEVATDGHMLHLIGTGSASGLWVQSCFEGESDADRTWRSWLSMLGNWLPLSETTSLAIYVGRHGDILNDLLLQLDGLVSLSIRVAAEFEMTDVRTSVLETLYSLLAYPTTCPKLREIKIDVAAAEDGCPDLRFDGLRRMEAGRAAAGCPLSRVLVQPWAQARQGKAEPPAPQTILLPTPSFAAVEIVEICPPGAAIVHFNEHDKWTLNAINPYWRVEAPDRILPWEIE